MTKLAQTHPLDRLDRLADLADLIEVGLIGLRGCDLRTASHGLGWIAVQIQDELREVNDSRSPGVSLVARNGDKPPLPCRVAGVSDERCFE